MKLLVLRTPPFAYLLFVIFLAGTSCKKDSKSPQSTNSNTLTGTAWTSQKVEFQQADNTWKEKTDPDFHWVFTFNVDNTFSVTQTFASGSKTTLTGSWHLANNNTQLTLSDNHYQGIYTITQLSGSALQWSVVSPGFWGISGAVRETFSH